jgi:RNA polymerase sigma factor (sigma-70 family)
MTEISEINRENLEPRGPTVCADDIQVAAWFVREVLPLEAILMQFLNHNWQNKNDIADLRQEVYVRLCEAAQKQIPDHTKRFVLATARNLLIDRVRREHVVPIEAVADMDALNSVLEEPGPERVVMARDDLRRLQGALDHLPLRCREAVVLAHVEGLSGREIAARMGVTEGMVSVHLTHGIRALANLLYGEASSRGGAS